MLHKVYLKKHAVIEVDGEKKFFSGGEHLVDPATGAKLVTEKAGGVLLEKHDTKTGEVEAVKPSVVNALVEGDAVEAAKKIEAATPAPAKK